MKKTYHIVTRAARESAAVIEQFCQTNGQILLPIVELIQNASQVVEHVIHEIGHQMLEEILVCCRNPTGREFNSLRPRARCGCCPSGHAKTVVLAVICPRPDCRRPRLLPIPY